MVSCEKDCPEPTAQPQRVNHVIHINTVGQMGAPYSYKVWCLYDPADFNTFDTTAPPTMTISGYVDPYSMTFPFTMDRDEFYYIIGYRDTVQHTDSFWYSHASGSGWGVVTMFQQYRFFNRSKDWGTSFPATNF